MTRPARSCVRACGRERMAGSRTGLCFECLTGAGNPAPYAEPALPFPPVEPRPQPRPTLERDLPTEREALTLGAIAAQAATAAAGLEWQEEAVTLVLEVAGKGAPFTSNDVWAAGLSDPPTGDRRALGAVMQRLGRDGKLRKVGSGAVSRLGHGASNLAVWQAPA